jgi:hypothetical protein
LKEYSSAYYEMAEAAEDVDAMADGEGDGQSAVPPSLQTDESVRAFFRVDDGEDLADVDLGSQLVHTIVSAQVSGHFSAQYSSLE